MNRNKKIMSLNCNGIRSASQKGLHKFLEEENFDTICFQEIKALEENFDLDFYKKLGYNHSIYPAKKKGYSGTATFSKEKTLSHNKGMGLEKFDQEGRILELEFSDYYLINSYFPSGTSGEERQDFKMDFLNSFIDYIERLEKSGKPIILTGDINIAHKEIDIHDPKGNKKSSGFLPEERAWIDTFLSRGYVDAFRLVKGNIEHEYSWWTYRHSARTKNKGWRIDYFFISKNLGEKTIDCGIFTNKVFSDHAPIYLVMR